MVQQLPRSVHVVQPREIIHVKFDVLKAEIIHAVERGEFLWQGSLLHVDDVLVLADLASIPI